jgi:hypothetical protein
VKAPRQALTKARARGEGEESRDGTTGTQTRKRAKKRVVVNALKANEKQNWRGV